MPPPCRNLARKPNACAILSTALLLLSFNSLLASTPWEGKVSDWKGFQRYDFTIDGREAFVVTPQKAAPGNPWVWRARFPTYHTGADVILLGQGFHIAYINTNDMLGSPAALDHWDAFYETLTTKHGLAKKVAPIAAAKIPILHIISLDDAVVPPQENTFILAKRYQKLGGKIGIIKVEKGTKNSDGHHFPHPDPERVAKFIATHASPD